MRDSERSIRLYRDEMMQAPMYDMQHATLPCFSETDPCPLKPCA